MAMPLLGLELSINFCRSNDRYAVARLIYGRICKPSAAADSKNTTTVCSLPAGAAVDELLNT